MNTKRYEMPIMKTVCFFVYNHKKSVNLRSLIWSFEVLNLPLLTQIYARKTHADT